MLGTVSVMKLLSVARGFSCLRNWIMDRRPLLNHG